MTPDLPADPDVKGFFNYTFRVLARFSRCRSDSAPGPITVTIPLQTDSKRYDHPGPTVVNSLADSDDGTCDAADCTLREAINAANANGAGADTITFSVSGQILLGGPLANITSDLTIDGFGRSITVGGNSATRVLFLGFGRTLNLNAVTIANGNVVGNGAGLLVSTNATANITNSTFRGNIASNLGGAIAGLVSSTINVSNSSFFSNSAITGGAIFIDSQTSLRVNSSTFTGNSVNPGSGGAIYGGVMSTFNVTNSTFFANSASNQGGAISSASLPTSQVINSTFSTNSSSLGASISSSGMTLSNTLLVNGIGPAGVSDLSVPTR